MRGLPSTDVEDPLATSFRFAMAVGRPVDGWAVEGLLAGARAKTGAAAEKLKGCDDGRLAAAAEPKANTEGELIFASIS